MPTDDLRRTMSRDRHGLRPRERLIISLIADGLSNEEISRKLCRSRKTIEKHRSNLMAKLNLHSVAAVTRFAIAEGYSHIPTISSDIVAALVELRSLIDGKLQTLQSISAARTEQKK